MTMTMRALAVSTAICGVLACPGRSSAQSREVAVAGRALVVDYPKDWNVAVSGPAVGPTVRLSPGGHGDFEVLITALVSRKALPDDAAVRRFVRESGERLLPTAIQTNLELQPVTGAEARGYIFHLTEKGREKGPGDFKELHQGTVVVGPLLLSVTVLTHSGDNDTVSAALKAVASVRYKAKR
jgi:hypothetical protein